MGRERARKGQYFYFCLALLVLLSNCSLSQESIRRRDMQDALHAGNQMLVAGDFDGSLRAFEKVVVMAGARSPADVAAYKSGLVYAHPNNPKRDLRKAISAFSRVASSYPKSDWGEQAKIWVEVLKETEDSKEKLEEQLCRSMCPSRMSGWSKMGISNDCVLSRTRRCSRVRWKRVE